MNKDSHKGVRCASNISGYLARIVLCKMLLVTLTHEPHQHKPGDESPLVTQQNMYMLHLPKCMSDTIKVQQALQHACMPTIKCQQLQCHQDNAPCSSYCYNEASNPHRQLRVACVTVSALALSTELTAT
jgi:hypothetical protein